MKKEITIIISVDCEKDEWGNVISCKGFDDGKPIQNTAEILGWIELIKQQEIRKAFPK